MIETGMKRIRENDELIEEKQKILERLEIINKKLNEQAENCPHECIIYLGQYQVLNSKKIEEKRDFRCLFCPKKKDFNLEPKRIIDASSYKSEKYKLNSESDQDEKMNDIKRIYRRLFSENCKSHLIEASLIDLLEEQINSSVQKSKTEKMKKKT